VASNKNKNDTDKLVAKNFYPQDSVNEPGCCAYGIACSASGGHLCF